MAEGSASGNDRFDRSLPDSRRQLPSVNELLSSPVLIEWLKRVSRAEIVGAARSVLAECRRAIEGDDSTSVPATTTAWAEQVEARLQLIEDSALVPVINGTGILLHTGLGRAPLAPAAVDALRAIVGQYSSLEIDLGSGERGRRSHSVRRLLTALTGAESATVVNNNAAALLLVLSTLARGRSVVVSRGELIEIGGSFRLPEIMAVSGVELREVGTTNKTRLDDYASAIDDQVAAVLKVHPSNFQVSGFTESVSLSELSSLARGRHLPLVHDIGSGALIDMSRFGVHREPIASESIDAGADIVLFSGDKLMGGPQSGIIVGTNELVAQIERNPLMRVLRVDKLTMAALQATLELYRRPDTLNESLPLATLITIPIADLLQRAEKMIAGLSSNGAGVKIDVVNTEAYVGGGSCPEQAIESVAVRITSAFASEAQLALRLRTATPAVIPRVHDKAVLIDLRGIFQEQDPEVRTSIRNALSACGSPANAPSES